MIIVPLLIVNLIWTGVALYINYSWQKEFDERLGGQEKDRDEQG